MNRLVLPMLLALTALLSMRVEAQLMRQPQPKITTALSTTTVQPGQQVVLAVVLDIADGYHAQSNTPLEKNLIPLTVKVEEQPTSYTAFGSIYPEPHIETYPILGKVSVFTGQTIVFVPIEVAAGVTSGPIEIKGSVRYQICDDQTCFAPKTEQFTVASTVTPAGQPTEANQAELFATFDPRVWSSLKPVALVEAAASPEESGIDLGFGIRLTDNSYALAFLAAFFAGIIFNIVPCVLPVLPLKAIGFYEVAQHNRAKCFALGVMFSLGIVATFGVLALLVLVLRVVEWGQLFGNPWFAGAVTLILVAVAIGMFGLYGVTLPTKVYEFTPRHDTYTGNLLFGVLTAILSTPCTFGLFVGLLFWAVAQPAWIGTLAVMTTGLGMAAPYLMLSAVPEVARKFPRTGPWSEVVKQMTGFLLLAVAAYFGRMFLPDNLRGPGFWWVIFGFVAAALVFLIIRTVQLAPRTRPILISTAIALVIAAPALYATIRLANPPMQWVYFSEQALQDARGEGRPVVVKFTADWCLNCQTVEATVFGDHRMIDQLQRDRVVAIKADLTKESAAGWTLLRELNPVGAIPFTAVYLPGEDEPRKLAGIYSSTDLQNALNSSAAPVATAR